MQDHELLSKIANGDLTALRQLFEKYKDSIFNLCYRFTKNRQEAEDLCQDVFLKIYHSASNFRGQSHPSTWVYRITVNLCLNHNRRKNRFLWIPLENEEQPIPLNSSHDNSEENDPHDQLEKAERERIVQQAILKLPRKQCIALILQRYEGLTIKEIAEVMNCSELSVQSRLARARENLAKKLLPFARSI